MNVEDLKAHCVDQMRKLPKGSRMYEEHLITLAIIDTNKKYVKEIDKLNKMIDLMAETLAYGSEVLKDEDYCFKSMECEVVGGNLRCRDCIKQYFEKRVEDGD